MSPAANFAIATAIWGSTYADIYVGSEWLGVQIVAVDPSVARAGIEDGIVDPSDIVAAAKKLAKLYPKVSNDNDCHNIASTVAAAAGAVLTPYSGNTDNPKENQEYGFWRIAYRGTDDDATSDWSRLIEPGDIVRMGWKGGGFHTATILSVNKNGSFEVFDNAAGNGEINIHTVHYDTATVKRSVTIYRLSDDHLFLVNGTSGADIVTGTLFADKLVGGAGADTIGGGLKADVLLGGAGGDLLEGGPGADRFVFLSLADSRNAQGGRDTIVDFGNGGAADKIDLRAIDANGAAPGNQRFDFIGEAPFSGKPGELNYVRGEAGTDVHADVDGDGNSDFAIHFSDVLVLGKGDFVL